MSVSLPVPSAPAVRDRSVEATRAARLKKFERDRLVVDYLNRGVPMAEIAMRLDVTEKRMRAIVREALASYLPGPPEEFVALQMSRLNEALLVAYSAMSGRNLKAVAQVVKIVRELDRYNGFFPAERGSRGGPRPLALSEAEAKQPLALLANRSGMALQPLEKPRSAPGTHRHAAASDEAFALPLEPDEYWSDQLAPALALLPGEDPVTAVDSRPDQGLRRDSTNCHPHLADGRAQDACAADASPIDRPEMAPQAPEKAQSAPANSTTPDFSEEPHLSPPAEAAQARNAPHASPIDRPEMAPQATEKAQSAPANSTAPDFSKEPYLSPLAEAAPAMNAPHSPQLERPQMAPQVAEKAQSSLEDDKAPASSDEFLAEAAPMAAVDPDPAAEDSPADPIFPPPGADVAPLAGGPDPAEEVSSQAEAAPPAPAIVGNVLLPPHARPQPGPTAFTGFIRCGGRVTYYL